MTAATKDRQALFLRFLTAPPLMTLAVLGLGCVRKIECWRGFVLVFTVLC